MSYKSSSYIVTLAIVECLCLCFPYQSFSHNPFTFKDTVGNSHVAELTCFSYTIVKAQNIAPFKYIISRKFEFVQKTAARSHAFVPFYMFPIFHCPWEICIISVICILIILLKNNIRLLNEKIPSYFFYDNGTWRHGN